MTEQAHWRRNRPISLPAEDNTRLEHLKSQAEAFCLDASYSLIVRAGLQQLAKLSERQFREAIASIPPTRYGPEPRQPRPTLSDEERDELKRKLGLR